MRRNFYYRAARIFRAISFRSEMFGELLRLRHMDGTRLAGAWRDILIQPARVDDALLMRRFVPHSRPVCIIDVGANNGAWAAKMLRFFTVERLVAFEADPVVAQQFELRHRHRHFVRLHSVGLSDRDGTAPFHRAADPHHSSLSELIGQAEVETTTVTLRSLNAFAAEIFPASGDHIFTILKIDVQGHEVEVLKGANEVLPRIDLVYIECSFAASRREGSPPSFSAVCVNLAAFGFHPVLFRDYGRHLGPYAVERDVVFVRADRSADILGYG